MANSDLIDDFRNDETLGSDDVVARIMEVVNRYYQEATVTEVAGSCPYGHCKGDKFKVTSMNSDGLCGALYQAIHSQIVTLHHGGTMQWGKDPDMHRGVCPEGVVHLEVKRVAKQDRAFFKTPTKTVDMTGKNFPGIDKYKIYLEVISIANNCVWGHREGEILELDAFNVGNCCGFMYRGIYHYINLLLSGGGLAWEGDQHIVHGCCPDPFNQLTYRLIREER
jgi:uncharacterized repeat protein (TIGR04076 family)